MFKTLNNVEKRRNNRFEGGIRNGGFSNFEKRGNWKSASMPNRAVANIVELKDRDYYSGTVKIMKKSQPGPVIFVVSDGYGSVDAMIKDSDYEVGDVIEISGTVNERAGRLQLEIESMRPSKKDFNLVLEENSVPKRTQFSIKSERLEKLKPYFIKIAKRIRKAVLESQPILIRHHADSDGITAGLAIEQSCKKFMEKIGVNPEYALYRSPSKAPFYEIADVFRDIILSNRLIEFKQKKPLIIVLDNGSTPEDVLGLKTLHSLGFEVIVVDHHNPVVIENKKTAVDAYVSLHLNPYIEGLDSQTCAGMLAYELGRMIFEEYENSKLPAVAGISDLCRIPETDEYIKNTGKTKEFLAKIGKGMDFIAYNIKFDSGKGLYDELFKNEKFVAILDEEVTTGFETQLQSTMPYLRTQDIDGVIFSYIDLEKYTVRFKYPAPGKVIGAIHDIIALQNENRPVITIGHLSDMIIFRASKAILPVQKIIKKLRKDLPSANVDGGGHEMAGAIKFVSAHLTDIIENIKQQIKDVKYLENSQEGKEEK